MNAYFENFSEEINAVINRSRKDNNTSIYTIQKSIHPHVLQFNGVVEESFINTIFGVNLAIVSAEGYYIYGSTNRLHLPDFMSRLYQSLDNLLKANNGHNCNTTNSLSELSNEVKENIQYSDVANFDISYLNSLLTEIYNSLDPEFKEKLNISLKICGNYSLWMSGNSLGGYTEYDDLFLTISCDIYRKADIHNSCSVSELITSENLREKNFKVEEYVQKIERYARALCDVTEATKEHEVAINIQDIRPDIIVMDSVLSHALIYKLFSDYFLNASFKGLQNDKEKSSLLTSCVKDDVSDTAKERLLYQNSFLIPPLNCQRVLKVGNDAESQMEISDLETFINRIKKDYKTERVLYLSGINNNRLDYSSHDLIVAPTTCLYFEKKDKFSLDLNMLCIESIEGIELAGQKSLSVFELDPFNMPFCIHGNETAILHVDAQKVRYL